MFDTNPDPASGRHSLLSILAGMLAVRAIGVGANAVGDAVGSKLGALPLVGGWVSEYGSPLVRNVVGVGAAWLLASRTRAGFSEGVQLAARPTTGAALRTIFLTGLVAFLSPLRSFLPKPSIGSTSRPLISSAML